MTDCKYFGVRTSKREGALSCQNCKKTNLELFKKCTRETNILMATSISVDAKGNTIAVLPGKVDDSKLLVETN